MAVIIGILIAGIATGKSLVLQGELNSSIRELQSLKGIVSSFQTRYDFFPGDLPNATNYWPDATTSNGDGNGFIDSTVALIEDTYVFQHLSLSRMLPGNFIGGIPGDATRFVFGINSFSSKKQSGSYQIGNSNSIYGETSNAVQLGSLTDSVSGYPDGGLFSPQDAANIDNKIDDGLASSGFYRATEGVNTLLGHCTDGNIDATAGTVSFVLSSIDNAGCRVFLILPN